MLARAWGKTKQITKDRNHPGVGNVDHVGWSGKGSLKRGRLRDPKEVKEKPCFGMGGRDFQAKASERGGDPEVGEGLVHLQTSKGPKRLEEQEQNRAGWKELRQERWQEASSWEILEAT